MLVVLLVAVVLEAEVLVVQEALLLQTTVQQAQLIWEAVEAVVIQPMLEMVMVEMAVLA